jgi:hypothetical protein
MYELWFNIPEDGILLWLTALATSTSIWPIVPATIGKLSWNIWRSGNSLRDAAFRRKPAQSHFVDQISHITWPGIEPASRPKPASDYLIDGSSTEVGHLVLMTVAALVYVMLRSVKNWSAICNSGIQPFCSRIPRCNFSSTLYPKTVGA